MFYTTLRYNIYIYPFYIYIYIFIYIYIYIFFFAIHLYICSYIFIFIYLYAFIYLYSLFIFIYINYLHVFYTKVFTTLYITMYKNVTLSRPDVPTHAFIYRYNTFLSFVSNRIIVRAPRAGSTSRERENASTGIYIRSLCSVIG